MTTGLQPGGCNQAGERRRISPGQKLWHIQTGAPVVSAPATVVLNGKQHVLLAAGGALFAFALP